ncbi:hypothetical protein [Streptococcus sp. IMAU 99161]|uniref:hypothetical protein n=1 Tax=Streptococcus sp. IMAU 99161 TaxID=2710601 RepID=UPI0016550281|nr:hypothetical protein [Streptococcus sp. IMAU 99161]MBC8776748.1 hypothetical protein [Streptococcus sp. IMAU 99161]
MKNKIILSSVTLLSAFILAACGNGEKKATETVAASTTEVAKETTAAPTTKAQTTTPGSSSGAKEISLVDTQRIGNEKFGYINIPKDWVVHTTRSSKALEYLSPDKKNALIMDSNTKDTVKLGPNETFDAELLANRLYSSFGKHKNRTSIEGVKAIFAGGDAFLIKVTVKDGSTLYVWVFQKGDKVYTIIIQGSEDMIKSLRPVLEQSWGLDPNTPGK